jgi:nickel-type superoxide dismutase maturation protease
MATEIRSLTWRERVLLYTGRLRAYRVEGDSMLPTLYNGEAVLIDMRAKIEPGDIVAANHPYMRSVKLIKRVESIDSQGRFVLRGDNPADSTDSRSFGSITANSIAGKVVRRFKV